MLCATTGVVCFLDVFSSFLLNKQSEAKPCEKSNPEFAFPSARCRPELAVSCLNDPKGTKPDSELCEMGAKCSEKSH